MCSQIAGTEVSSLDYKAMIGGAWFVSVLWWLFCGTCLWRFGLADCARHCLCAGPLVAVVNAQAQAALSTASFIRTVGFDEEGKSVSVEFSYDTVNSTTGETQVTTVRIPLLAMLPIPYLKVSLVWAREMLTVSLPV
jgi:hypothetical protein